MVRVSAFVLGILVAGLGAGSAGSLAQAPADPLESDLTEEVEVRFVILDALVVDSQGKVATDLGVDDFKLYLDLLEHPLASVDLECPRGAVVDPVAVAFGEKRELTAAPGLKRRMALVIDYKNLPQTLRVEVVDLVAETVRNNFTPGDELMLAAITRRLRVEQPFTSDPQEILDALERMKHDVSLWQEQPIPHPHEFDLYDGLTALVRLLASYEGTKAVVLFSDLPTKVPDAEFVRPMSLTPAAFDYDVQHAAVATSATDARVAIYPVHSSGLTFKRSSDRLARLAVETGGRFTRYTNDLSLAYVRAQRDLACRYAVGFYDRKPGENRVRRVNLKVRRPDLRVHHPVLYRFGSDDVARASLSDTVFTAPQAFEDRSVRGGFVPLRPVSGKRWECAAILRFPVSVPENDEVVVTFGAKLEDAARRAVHAFDSQIALQGRGAPGEQVVVVIEPVELAPGSYELSLVVNDPQDHEPRAAVLPVEVPELPRKQLVVAGPLLARPAPEGVIVSWPDDSTPMIYRDGARILEPVLPDLPVSPGEMVAVTRLCLPRSEKVGMEVALQGEIVAEDGPVLVAGSPLTVELTAQDEQPCRVVHEDLSTSELPPGTYRFRLSVAEETRTEPFVRSATFVVE